MPTPLPIGDRRIRIAVVGLGTVSELCLPPYRGRDDVEVVGLCDLDPARVGRWQAEWPDAFATTDLDQLWSVDADVVDVLVPTPLHGDGEPMMAAPVARDVLATLLTALDAGAAGRPLAVAR